MNRKQKLNKILHSHIEVNPNEDYTNYKNLIAELDSFVDTEIEQSSITTVVQVCEHESYAYTLNNEWKLCDVCGKEFK